MTEDSDHIGQDLTDRIRRLRGGYVEDYGYD